MDFRVLLAAPLAALVMTSSAAELRMPEGWMPTISFAWPLTTTYEVGVDPSMDEPGRHSLSVQSVGTRDALEVGAVTQWVIGYAGKRVRFSAQVKAAGADTWAGLVLGNKMVHLIGLGNADGDAMAHTYGAKAGADWQTVSVVVDVPSDGSWITAGLALVGNGKVWARDLKLDVVGQDVPLSTSHVGMNVKRAQERIQKGQEAMVKMQTYEIPPQNLGLN